MEETPTLSSSWGPLAGQVYVQASYTAMILITRVALAHGMSHYYYVMYRQVAATLTVCPLAFFLIVIRLEEVKVKSRRGQAKVLGTLLCVAGAMVMTLAKGLAPPPPSAPTSTSTLDLMPDLLRSMLPEADGAGGWILGAFLVCTGSWMWSAFFIYQARVAGEYPSQLWLSAMVCLMGMFQSAALAFSLDSPAALILRWDFQLLVVTYSGIFSSGLGFFATMWCVKERGPVYTAAFNPLSTVLVAILEPLLLHVHLHWASLVAMGTVIGGLYCVLWGKAEDGKAGRAAEQEPLLANTTSEC